MKIALVHQHFDAAHLEAVKEKMLELGAPKIKAVRMDCYGFWVALEGSHRIRAAKKLGFMPKIEEIEYSEVVTTQELGLDFGGDIWTVAQIADTASNAKVICFDNDDE
jgi:hypothetical protein